MRNTEAPAGSLQNLHDIVMPAAVGWWPVAPGWYLLAAAMAAGLLWAGIRSLRRYRRDRYRRAALRELERIRRDGPDGQPETEIARLLKQTALAAWPRVQVASLSGANWSGFLVQTGASEADARRLENLAYRRLKGGARELEQLCAAAEQWIRKHRREMAEP